MIEIGGDAPTSGPYARQTCLVKIANVLGYSACVDMLIFVPVSLGAALIAGIRTRAPTRAGNYLPLLFLAVMLGIGAWLNDMGLRWFTGERMPRSGRWLVFAGYCILPAGTSAIAIWFHIWPQFLICVIAYVPIGLLSSWLLVGIDWLQKKWNG